jgi:hypothetical protein
MRKLDSGKLVAQVTTSELKERGDDDSQHAMKRVAAKPRLPAKTRRKRGAANGPEPMAWLGTKRDFGDLVFKLHRKNLIPGRNWVDALRIVGAHFVDNEGKGFKPENIRESIRVRGKREGKGGPGEGLKLD